MSKLISREGELFSVGDVVVIKDKNGDEIQGTVTDIRTTFVGLPKIRSKYQYDALFVLPLFFGFILLGLYCIHLLNGAIN